MGHSSPRVTGLFGSWVIGFFGYCVPDLLASLVIGLFDYMVIGLLGYLVLAFASAVRGRQEGPSNAGLVLKG